jgi:NAD(P)-dependent dehydrogenase (short-subunit alcohol dehydrogenase family)
MTCNLAGKVALINGGSRGMGREIALAYARAGADIVVASRKLDACEIIAAEVRALGRRALAQACHIGRWNDIHGLVDAAYAALGRVDILVNSAGMSPIEPHSEDTSEELFDKVIAVNFKGPFRLASLIARRMADDNGGSIINISSTASLMPVPGVVPYSGSKAALNAMTVAFAQEYGPKVRVNAIVAGPFLTDIAKAWPEEARTKTRSAIGRPGYPEEIVSTALYLADPASSFVTGALIRVDGCPY